MWKKQFLVLRGIARGLRARRPEASWSLAESLAVAATRELLIAASQESADVQRDWLTVPILRSAPKGVRCVDETISGVRCLRFIPPGCESAGIGVHFHGGGYTIGSVEEQAEYLGALAILTGMPMLTLEYRLAPENPYPAALEDGMAVLDHLLAGGQDPSQLVLLGDSAGGGLALAVLLKMRDENLSQLAGASLGSPCVALLGKGESMERNRNADYLPQEMTEVWAQMYAGEMDPNSPKLSPLYACFAGLPPLQFLVGEREIFYDDILQCARKSEEAKVATEVIVGGHAVHCWYRGGTLRYPGPTDTLQTIARFLRACTES